MRKRMIHNAAAAAALLVALPAMARAQVEAPQVGARAATSEQELLAASRAVANAQVSFDLEALEAWLAPGYVEVTPIGDVDEREEVLSFYTPEAKAAMLERGIEPLSVNLVEPQVHLFGDHGVVITRQEADLRIHGALQQRTFRATHHFRKIDGEWLLQSAQFTPIETEPKDERD